MMSLIARLCALCAVCTAVQMALPEDKQEPVQLLGGLLMMHLVVTNAHDLCSRIVGADGVMRIFAILME